uniref:Pentatricopeptide repeat domain 2 n=1 Tax=Cyprinus carpio TaxID=7962 RepID=A0A8C1YVQ3_CYPCA
MALRGLNACARILLTDFSRAAVLRGAIKPDCLKCRHGAKRYLLSEDVVKLQGFQQRKLAVTHQVSKSKGRHHLLGLEELGARTLRDPDSFQTLHPFNIAIVMIFTKQCYKSCLEVLGEMKKQGVPFNKDTFMLAFATCYKLNTSKSYHICLTLLEEGQTKGTALALKQNDIERAQAFFSQVMNTESRLCQNLRVLILAMKGSMKEAVSALTTALLSKTQVFVKKPEFSQEVVRYQIHQSSLGKVEQVVRPLEEAGQITKQTIDDFLCHTPSRRRRPLGILEQERKPSQKTRRTLQSTLE